MHSERPNRLRLPPRRDGSRPSISTYTLGLVVLTLPLGTTPIELATVLGLAVALPRLLRGPAHPLLGPAVALLAAQLTQFLAVGGSPHALMGNLWAVAPLLALPALAQGSHPRNLLRLAALAWLPGTAVALWQLRAGVPVSGLFSHHLTLAYVAVPTVLIAITHRHWPLAALAGFGLLSTGSMGALLALLVGVGLLLPARPARRLALPLGLAALYAGLFLASNTSGVHERAVLWTAGLDAAVGGGFPLGGWRLGVADLHERLYPGFDFPHHAHDSLLQLIHLGSIATWAALAWCGVRIAKSGRPLLAAIGGAWLVGALTQDLFGDREVTQATALWLAVAWYSVSPGTPASAKRPTEQPAQESP